MPKYPEWVYRFKEPGTAVKKSGDTYYLVKNTSKRVPGKKNPQPVQTYIGVITENGVVRSGVKRLDASDVVVREYGFTTAVKHLMQPSVSAYVPGDETCRRAAIQQMILAMSPFSCIQDEEEMLDWKGSPSVLANLEDRFWRSVAPLEKEDLECLKGVFVMDFAGKRLISRIDEEQKAVFRRIGLEAGS